jgi:hypothetical protein
VQIRTANVPLTVGYLLQEERVSDYPTLGPQRVRAPDFGPIRCCYRAHRSSAGGPETRGLGDGKGAGRGRTTITVVNWS